MISATLLGQTGNQMFTIATLMALALDNGDTWQVPTHSSNKQRWPLLYKELPTIPYEEAKWISVTYREPSFGYTPIPYSAGMKLRGYFQSEKYFAHRRAEVLALFKREWPKFEPLKNTVGIHVRRGDYLKHSNNHPSPSVAWIHHAIGQFDNKTSFLFFSEDHEWCRKNFPDHQMCVETDTLKSMALLSSCEHQIVSASTFGWWAAYANENPNKVVIAPKVWFGPGKAHLESKDIVPTNWIQI